MANELTRDMVEKVIAELLKVNGKSENCMACNDGKPKGLHIPILCTAHWLELLLTDYERAGDRLSEAYFRAKAEIK